MKELLHPPQPKNGIDLYCPHKPWPKQQLFIDLDCEEVLYGGAAGGGKSDALLMAALKYAHVPGYSALILRRDFARLSLSGAIMDRAKLWFYDKAKWNEQRKTFTFPSGATLQFGFIDNPNDRMRYQGTEYHFIGWDELTEFALTHDENNPYTFLFRSLRTSQANGIPLRVRSTSNPGNVGHEWVKSRFITTEAENDLRNDTLQDVYYIPGEDQPLAFIPAKIRDNPALNEADYRKKLAHMPPVTRERMMNGDWSIMPMGLVNVEWLRYYDMQGQHLRLYDADGKMLLHEDERQCRRFCTIDTAGTSADKAKESKGKPPSWSVIGTWDVLPAKYGLKLCLRHIWRKRVGFTDLVAGVREIYREWKPSSLKVEDATMGPALWDLLRGEMPIQTIGTGGKDKVTRAAPLLNMLERGEVFLPRYNGDWRPNYEAELLSWQGLDDETADQIDVSSYAAMEVHGGSMQTIQADWAFWKR